MGLLFFSGFPKMVKKGTAFFRLKFLPIKLAGVLVV